MIMPHIPLPDGLYGIRSAMAFRPEAAEPLNLLVELLLSSSHPLTRGERELVATRLGFEQLSLLPKYSRGSSCGSSRWR
jgi:alkylhydroperoxidase family enzyme